MLCPQTPQRSPADGWETRRMRPSESGGNSAHEPKRKACSCSALRCDQRGEGELTAKAIEEGRTAVRCRAAVPISWANEDLSCLSRRRAARSAEPGARWRSQRDGGQHHRPVANPGGDSHAEGEEVILKASRRTSSGCGRYRGRALACRGRHWPARRGQRSSCRAGPSGPERGAGRWRRTHGVQHHPEDRRHADGRRPPDSRGRGGGPPDPREEHQPAAEVAVT